MDDSRWVHRPKCPEDKYATRDDPETVAGQLYAGFQRMIRVRKRTQALAGGRAVGFYTGNAHILGYQRPGGSSTVLCLANFNDDPEWIGRERFMGMPREAKNLISGYTINLADAGVQLRGHQYLWLLLKS